MEIPSHYLIGDWNKGFYSAMEGFNCARPLVAAACLALRGNALESGIEYIKRDGLLVRLLRNLKACSFKWREAYAKLESASCLSIKAAWMLGQMYTKNGLVIKKVNKAVASAKLIAPTVAFDIIKDVLIWHGAYGYTKRLGWKRV